MSITLRPKSPKIRKPVKKLPARAWFGKRKLAFLPELDSRMRGDYSVSNANGVPGFVGETITQTLVERHGEWDAATHSYKPKTTVRQREVYEHETNLVTSLLPNGNHAVTLDLDYPAKLVPSRTKGHFHLYLDPLHELSWKQYKKLLRVLADCGLIEKGYADASIKKGFTAVRKPQTDSWQGLF